MSWIRSFTRPPMLIPHVFAISDRAAGALGDTRWRGTAWHFVFPSWSETARKRAFSQRVGAFLHHSRFPRRSTELVLSCVGSVRHSTDCVLTLTSAHSRNKYFLRLLRTLRCILYVLGLKGKCSALDLFSRSPNETRPEGCLSWNGGYELVFGTLRENLWI